MDNNQKMSVGNICRRFNTALESSSCSVQKYGRIPASAVNISPPTNTTSTRLPSRFNFKSSIASVMVKHQTYRLNRSRRSSWLALLLLYYNEVSTTYRQIAHIGVSPPRTANLLLLYPLYPADRFLAERF
jgi:hypothetical protein